MPHEPSTSRPAWRLFAIPAVVVLVGYILLFAWDSRLRTHRGPWEITFDQSEDGTPVLRIDQPALGIRKVEVRFVGEQIDPEEISHVPAVVRFEQPFQSVPFGKIAFDDLMYQPGTVVLHAFGHEVQVLPRALFLDRREHAWKEGGMFDLTPEMKVRDLTPPPRLRSPAPAARTPAADGGKEVP